jgi:trimethylamine--corrinoid protein Co-methyltransferase
VLDNEWIDAYNYAVSGYEVTEETIALELMHEIGAGGNFMAEEHTVENLRGSWWKSGLFDRVGFDVWEKAGKPELLDKAAGLVERYTEGYTRMEPAIPGNLADEIERIYEKGRKSILC